MRIVIDMQGAQTESRYRGIGRYTLSFAQAVVRNRGEHEIFLALNGLFPETIEPIRTAFEGLLPPQNVRVWYIPGPVKERDSQNHDRRKVAELARETFLNSFAPDLVHISSLFEGYDDDAVTSIGSIDRRVPVSVTLHDLIPLLNPEQYLDVNPDYAAHYYRKIKHLKNASVYLAVSESSRMEGIANLELPENRVINTLEAVEDRFQPVNINKRTALRIRRKFGIAGDFILYTGGADERKNLRRLISAYAALPLSLRDKYQLLFAGRIPGEIKSRLELFAEGEGLSSGDLCFTGFVSDEELIHLYNMCHLYVFPSWHEGFGLPALEAMACGAAVIGSNTSSLPEVIGLDSALFNPESVGDISHKIQSALENEEFRLQLKKHGLEQAKKFSWDRVAERAIKAWEVQNEGYSPFRAEYSIGRDTVIKRICSDVGSLDRDGLGQLARCLALNERASVRRQLFLDISELVKRDAATGVQRVVRSYLLGLIQNPPKNFTVEPVYAGLDAKYRYARNFTRNFLSDDSFLGNDDLIFWQRGDVFFGLDLQHHVQLAHEDFFLRLRDDGVVVKFLIHDLLPIQHPEFFDSVDLGELHADWLRMISRCDGAICVSKATADAYASWMSAEKIVPTPNFQNSWVHNGADVSGSSPSVGLPSDSIEVLDKISSRLTFLCVSTLEPRKGQRQLLSAIEIAWLEGLDVNLVLVGKAGWMVDDLVNNIQNHHEYGERLFWLNGISDEYLEKVYESSTALVANSVNEGFGLSIVEAAIHGIPVLARDIPVFREVGGHGAYYYSARTDSQLASAIKNWVELFEKKLHPNPNNIVYSTWRESTANLKRELIEVNYPSRQILVDISTLVFEDNETGIPRVVKNILSEWVMNPPDGFAVEPIYASVQDSFRYAKRFTANLVYGNVTREINDEYIEVGPGDIYISLDLNHHVPRAHDSELARMKAAGVCVFFVVYDLLPIQFPQFWEPKHQVDKVVMEWLSVISKYSGVFCISKSVADDFSDWRKKNIKVLDNSFVIDWFHLGADVNNGISRKGLPEPSGKTLEHIRAMPTFLMVGTIEPRKGHAQVLKAFEGLWAEGVEVNLVIVGKAGWLVESLVAQLREHHELEKHLFWLDGISDEYLEQVYLSSSCLIAASYGEGFGLPLIEAAQYNLPILARDIPVFREVAGDNASYFDGVDPESLISAVKRWLSLQQSQENPSTDGMSWLTWSQSAQNLLEKITAN